MKIFKARLIYGRAVVVANDITEAQTLLNTSEFIFGVVSIDDIIEVKPFVVTGGVPSIITWYQE